MNRQRRISYKGYVKRCESVLNYMINNPDTDRYKKKWNYHIESMKKLILDMNDNEKADFYAWW